MLLTILLSQDGGHSSFVADRAELVLHQSTRFGLHTRAQCLEYLGGLFRVALSVPARKTDYQASLVGAVQGLSERVYAGFIAMPT